MLPITWNSTEFQVADIAVGDLTITFEREKGVDFTMPFMNLGKQLSQEFCTPLDQTKAC